MDSGQTLPLGRVHSFDQRATPELAYIIGAMSGDASLNARLGNHQYRIRLKAKDKQFVEEFDRRVSTVLSSRVHKLWKTKDSEFYVEIGSYLLYSFLRRSLQELKPFIEHCESCTSAFIRGFFDSAGCVDKVWGRISGSNSDLSLLGYTQLLPGKFLGIKARGPYLVTRRGSILTRRGKSYVRKADCYSIYVACSDAMEFWYKIGLAIERKRLRLEHAMGLGEDASVGAGGGTCTRHDFASRAGSGI